jgi:hypothetical protein
MLMATNAQRAGLAKTFLWLALFFDSIGRRVSRRRGARP